MSGFTPAASSARRASWSELSSRLMNGSCSASRSGKRGSEASGWSRGTMASSLSSSSAVDLPRRVVGSLVKPMSALPSVIHRATS